MGLKLVTESKHSIWYASESGHIYRHKRTGDKIVKKRLSGFFRRGHMCIKFNGKTYMLKRLIAELFIDEFDSNYSIIFIDGNPKNCSIYNMIITTARPKKSGRTVVIDGKIYPSIRSAAKQLFISESCFYAFFSGKVQRSVLSDKNISFTINSDALSAVETIDRV